MRRDNNTSFVKKGETGFLNNRKFSQYILENKVRIIFPFYQI